MQIVVVYMLASVTVGSMAPGVHIGSGNNPCMWHFGLGASAVNEPGIVGANVGRGESDGEGDGGWGCETAGPC